MRIWKYAWSLSLLPLGLAAADPPTVAPSNPPEDALSAAQREFSAVKSARAGEAKQDMPTVGAVPEFHAMAGSAPEQPKVTVKAASPAAKKSGNWLVDGAANPTEKEQSASAEDKGRDEGPRTPSRTKTQVGQGNNRAGSEESPARRNLPDSNLNPLNRYMAGWMMPADLALLHSQFAVGSNDSRPGMPVDVFLGGTGDSTNDAAGIEALGPARAASAGGAEAAAASRPGNPYLESLAAPVSLPSGVNPVAPSATSLASPASRAEPLPSPAIPAPSKAPLPDFVKPRDDDKYFKPIKRF